MADHTRSSDAIDADRVRRETGIRHVEVFATLSSTNDEALRRVADRPSSLPLLVVAEEQTAGRGRGDNCWWSSRGALTFSVAMDRERAPIDRHWPRLSLIAGLAIQRVLATIVPHQDVRLKWPNDVFVSGHKACGVLVESSPVQPQPLVVGVGINVNNSLRQGPDELRDQATSLRDVTGRSFDRTEVLVAILRELDNVLERLSGADFSLPEQWRRCCYLEGRTVNILSGSATLVGVCQGIDDEGAILIQNESGIQRCFAGVVQKIL
jgi:BirA family biotin operon repressor/biotin-[acetyl-CoA-carboxylase] ligase